ncbi:MAG: DUF4928 family protein [Faecalicoccus sp.]|nr:DUF4928 family protein [Faecalicoccus sp.]
MSNTKNENQYEVGKKGLRGYLKSIHDKFNVYVKEKLSIVIPFTRMNKNLELPFGNSDVFMDDDLEKYGINEENFRRILADHGITIPLDDSDEDLDLESISSQDDVNNCGNKPFILSAEQSKSVQYILNSLLNQAIKRDMQLHEKKYRDALIKYLVAAQLQVIFPNQDCLVSSTFAEDTSINQSANFIINNTSIYCTSSPKESLMEKCKEDLNAGKHPVIITLHDREVLAMGFADYDDLTDRIEVWNIQQFLSTRILERSLFDESKRNSTLKEIIDRYNNIIDEAENDPSLKIEFETR